MKKRIFVLILAIMMILTSATMIACGKDETPPVDESTSQSSQSSQQSSQTPPPAPNPYDGMSAWVGTVD